MLTLMGKLWAFIEAKIGRLITGLGGLMALADIDISPIKPALEEVFSHKGVQAITIALFVLSFWRHQSVANRHPMPTQAP
jgi:hypothetical protein